jgi:DNA-binding GntR family transcriptional regulator
MPPKYKYRTMPEIAYDAIRDAILGGRYAPGQRLVTEDLARELGVSRMPVREALHRLQVAGLVSITPHRGAIVSHLSEAEVAEIFHIRAVLEGLATRLAATTLTPGDHKRLGTLLDEMGRAARAHDPEKVLLINRDFHAVFWKAARAPRLRELLENLYDACQRFRNLSVMLPGRLDQITQEHRRIVRALAQGDAAAAERHAKAHYEGTARRLLRSIELTRER